MSDDSNKKDSNNKGSGNMARCVALSLLGAFFIGAMMSLAWGAVSSLLHLESIFPGTASAYMFERPVPVQAALYGIASPFVEEMLFRKLLFDLVNRYIPAKGAAVIVSVLFALWHADVLQMLYAFPAGMVLQYMRLRSGRMAEPVVCHAGANITAIAVMAVHI